MKATANAMKRRNSDGRNANQERTAWSVVGAMQMLL